METREVAVKSQKLFFLGHIIRVIFSKIVPEPVEPEKSYITAFANIILLYKAKKVFFNGIQVAVSGCRCSIRMQNSSISALQQQSPEAQYKQN